jgi:ABC-type Fe3+-hydroxamate transport system substrate-binding protein
MRRNITFCDALPILPSMQVLKTVHDQMGREVTFSFPPKRIVSLVPSQTELLYDLGLDEEVVGQTIFCIHPAHQYQAKPRVGGTKNFKLDKIAALKPDLIIGNKEENEQTGIEALAKHFPVMMSDITTLDDALDMIKMVGAAVGKEENASQICSAITSGFSLLQSISSPQKKVAYFIWRNPWMVAGKNTFITSVLDAIGFENVFINKDSRYPEVTEADLLSAKPDVVFLSSEPYPFKEQHIQELKHSCPNAIVKLVDGELFSWYGSRLRYSSAYLKTLIQN